MTSAAIKELVETELSRILNSAMLTAIRDHSVAPYPVDRAWDYGHLGETFTCWTVLEHPPSNTGIAYFEAGAGRDLRQAMLDLGRERGYVQPIEVPRPHHGRRTRWRDI